MRIYLQTRFTAEPLSVVIGFCRSPASSYQMLSLFFYFKIQILIWTSRDADSKKGSHFTGESPGCTRRRMKGRNLSSHLITWSRHPVCWLRLKHPVSNWGNFLLPDMSVAIGDKIPSENVKEKEFSFNTASSC